MSQIGYPPELDEDVEMTDLTSTSPELARSSSGYGLMDFSKSPGPSSAAIRGSGEIAHGHGSGSSITSFLLSAPRRFSNVSRRLFSNYMDEENQPGNDPSPFSRPSIMSVDANTQDTLHKTLKQRRIQYREQMEELKKCRQNVSELEFRIKTLEKENSTFATLYNESLAECQSLMEANQQLKMKLDICTSQNPRPLPYTARPYTLLNRVPVPEPDPTPIVLQPQPLELHSSTAVVTYE